MPSATEPAPTESFTVLDDRALAALASPQRQPLLERLREPASAVSLARELGLSRQRVGYHMRELERAGCLQPVGERQRRGLKERLYRLRPMVWVSAPRGLRRPDGDRFSWGYLMSQLAAALWDLTRLRRLADARRQRLATLTLDTEIRFASAQARRDFTLELTDTLDRLVARYHDEQAASGRRFRLLVGAWPRIEDGDGADARHSQAGPDPTGPREEAS